MGIYIAIILILAIVLYLVLGILVHRRTPHVDLYDTLPTNLHGTRLDELHMGDCVYKTREEIGEDLAGKIERGVMI